MTAEEVFCGLFDKYGDSFNWYMISVIAVKWNIC